MPKLAELLAQAGNDGSGWTLLYDDVVDALRRVGVGAGAPRVVEAFPAFSLPDAGGHHRSLDALPGNGPMVLSFNLGGWCPYCTHELRTWNGALLGRLVEGDAEMLCDVDGGVALQSGLAFYLGAPLIRRYKEFGLDLSDIYGTRSGFQPLLDQHYRALHLGGAKRVTREGAGRTLTVDVALRSLTWCRRGGRSRGEPSAGSTTRTSIYPWIASRRRSSSGSSATPPASRWSTASERTARRSPAWGRNIVE